MRKQRDWILGSDIQLFHYLHDLKVATFDQIRRDLPGYECKQTLYLRLSTLEGRGFIHIYNDADMGKTRIVSLTDLAFNRYVNCGSACRSELKSKSVAHDVALVDLRHRLLQASKVAFYESENAIQTWNPKQKDFDFSPFRNIRCDAVVGLRVSNKIVPVALEFEASRKANARYDSLFVRYYTEDNFPLVLYICQSEKMVKMLSEREAGEFSRSKPKFFYATFENVVHKKSLEFVAHNGDRIDLSSV